MEEAVKGKVILLFILSLVTPRDFTQSDPKRRTSSGTDTDAFGNISWIFFQNYYYFNHLYAGIFPIAAGFLQQVMSYFNKRSIKKNWDNGENPSIHFQSVLLPQQRVTLVFFCFCRNSAEEETRWKTSDATKKKTATEGTCNPQLEPSAPSPEQSGRVQPHSFNQVKVWEFLQGHLSTFHCNHWLPRTSPPSPCAARLSLQIKT